MTRVKQTGWYVCAVIWLVVAIVWSNSEGVDGLRIQRPWSTRHWCEVLFDPHFPFAYAKVVTQGHESKGVVVDNSQHLGHVCTTRGARTKCHRCEDIACGSGLEEHCHFQVRVFDSETVDCVSLPPFRTHRHTFLTFTHTHTHTHTNTFCIFVWVWWFLLWHLQFNHPAAEHADPRHGMGEPRQEHPHHQQYAMGGGSSRYTPQ